MGDEGDAFVCCVGRLRCAAAAAGCCVGRLRCAANAAGCCVGRLRCVTAFTATAGVTGGLGTSIGAFGVHDGTSHTQPSARFVSAGFFEQPASEGEKSFFSEVISSVSDVKFSRDGRYLMARA